LVTLLSKIDHLRKEEGERGSYIRTTTLRLPRERFSGTLPNTALLKVESGGGEPFTGRAAIGCDYGYDAEVFSLGLALDPAYVEGFVEGYLERIGEGNPEEEQPFRDFWKDETQREVVIESLKADSARSDGEASLGS
jgi:hypothetical protein